jgi:hypothetical protein
VGSVFLLIFLILPVGVEAQTAPESTRVVVRAVSQDAKVIHDPVGGARITIREVASGRVLARGIQTGDSGSTSKIMEEPRVRGERIYEGAARFVARVPLEEPTVVEITAEGPLDYPQALQQASKTMLLTPGRDVAGDGVILTLHGFIVEIQSPEEVRTVDSGDTVDIRATVRMMCGCPTAPGGMWDADKIDIDARLLRDGRVVRRTALEYAGTRNTYEGALQIDEEGQYTLQVLSSDADRANFGKHERTITVE